MQMIAISIGNGGRQAFAILEDTREFRLLRPVAGVVIFDFRKESPQPAQPHAGTLCPEAPTARPEPALRVHYPSDYAGMPERVASGRTVGVRRSAQIKHSSMTRKETQTRAELSSNLKRGERRGGKLKGKPSCWKDVRLDQHR